MGDVVSCTYEYRGGPLDGVQKKYPTGCMYLPRFLVEKSNVDRYCRYGIIEVHDGRIDLRAVFQFEEYVRCEAAQ